MSNDNDQPENWGDPPPRHSLQRGESFHGESFHGETIHPEWAPPDWARQPPHRTPPRPELPWYQRAWLVALVSGILGLTAGAGVTYVVTGAEDPAPDAAGVAALQPEAQPAAPAGVIPATPGTCLQALDMAETGQLEIGDGTWNHLAADCRSKAADAADAPPAAGEAEGEEAPLAEEPVAEEPAPEPDPAATETTTAPAPAAPADPAPADAAEPKTAEAIRATATTVYDRYAAGDYGGMWDLWAAVGKQAISREDYIRLHELCPDAAQGIRWTLDEVTYEPGADIAQVRATRLIVVFVHDFVYEGGGWRFVPEDDNLEGYAKGVDQLVAEKQQADTCG